MLETERTLNQMNILYQQINLKEKDLTRRENALKVFLEGRKFTEREKVKQIGLERLQMHYQKKMLFLLFGQKNHLNLNG